MNNTTGNGNTAIGVSALYYNTTGAYNTANGTGALNFNTTGWSNVAMGAYALRKNTTPCNLVAIGDSALYNNGSGTLTGDQSKWNTAVGSKALFTNTTGKANSSFGLEAMKLNQAGDDNTGIGYHALNQSTGTWNTALGSNAGTNQTTGGNNIYIANTGTAAESDVIKIGSSQTATYLAGISGQTSASGVAVYVNASGKLGTLTSSARFKEDINDMGDASNVLMKLRPVTFKYKDEFADGDKSTQYGLIAEEVAKVAPNLVAYDKDGNLLTVYYNRVNAMLLNEVQKQQKEIVELRSMILEMKKKFEMAKK